MEEHFDDFLRKHDNSQIAKNLVDDHKEEIRKYKKYKNYFSYVAKKLPSE